MKGEGGTPTHLNGRETREGFSPELEHCQPLFNAIPVIIPAILVSKADPALAKPQPFRFSCSDIDVPHKTPKPRLAHMGGGALQYGGLP